MGAGQRNKWEWHIRAALFCAVFAAGLILSVYGVQRLAQSDRMRQYHDLHERAVYITGALQRVIRGYEVANQDLVAFITASTHLDGTGFGTYVETSNLFDQLPGLSSIGYLPRVPSSGIPAFEHEMRQQYPNYRVWGQNYAQPFHFPLAYAVNPHRATRVDELRGFDYASVVERAEAIEQVLQDGESRVTYMHQAITDREDSRVILLFTPVFSKTPGSGQAREVSGLVFSVLNVGQLFSGYDHGLIRETFDVELFEETVAPEALIYDGDNIPHILVGDATLPLVHQDVLQFSGMHWLLFLYQKGPVVAGGVSSAYAGTLLAGVLLSLLLAYAALRVRRHYHALAQEAWQSEHFTSFFENHPFPVYSLDRQRRFIAVNSQMERELGFTRDRLIGVSVDKFLSDENARITRSYFEQALEGKAVSYHNLVRSADGSESDLSIVLVPITQNGKVTSVLGLAKNVTQKLRAEQELHRSRQTLQLVLDNIPQLVFWKSPDGVYLGGNQQLLQFAGLERIDQLIGKTDKAMPWKEHAEAHMAEDRVLAGSGEARLKYQQIQVQTNGQERWLEISKVPMVGLDGGVDCILGVVDDITERKLAEAELFRRANFDALTGVANRPYFYHQLAQTMAEQIRKPSSLALVYFDIDRFKQINDTHGHGVGDQVIQEFARRVANAVRSTDLLARLGGDEFILLVRDAGSRDDLAVLARKLLSAMDSPFCMDDLRLEVRTSLGIACHDRGLTADQWIQRADQALYEAKRKGRNCYCFATNSHNDPDEKP